MVLALLLFSAITNVALILVITSVRRQWRESQRETVPMSIIIEAVESTLNHDRDDPRNSYYMMPGYQFLKLYNAGRHHFGIEPLEVYGREDLPKSLQ